MMRAEHDRGTTATAPIALFVYNRPDHTRRTVEALRANALAGDSDLFVYSDAPRSADVTASVQAVRDYLGSIDGFRSITIVRREQNWGVDPSIVDGVTSLCERFGRVIVLEDDLVTSPWFLQFMNAGLDRYAADTTVMQVGGFMFPIEGFDTTEAAFLPYATCWGWATWQRAWVHFDASASGYVALEKDPVRRKAFDLDGAYYYFALLRQYVDGRSSAWDIRWYLTIFQMGGLALFPHRSLVNNIGFDGSGVHDPVTYRPGDVVAEAPITRFPVRVEASPRLWRAVKEYLFRQQPAGLKQVVKRAWRQWAAAS